MAHPVDIVATGARTPIGMSPATAAAAVRAGVTRLRDHPFMVDQVGDPMPAAIDSQIDPALFGPPRFVALAETAIRQACAPYEGLLNPSAHLFVALPETRPGFSESDANNIRSSVAHIDALPVRISNVTTFAEGHAAGLKALTLATELIGHGELEACLVGGIESYFHPDTMEWLDANRQLVGSVSRSGFVPGEGSAFCLLMSERMRLRLGLNTLARVRGAATGTETKLIKQPVVCLGQGLTETVDRALSQLQLTRETITDIICDINTENYRNEEWGFVCLRLSQHFDDPTSYLSPADCWGDMGAASGPLFAMLACQASTRGVAKGNRTLLWASSEGGLRAAFILGFEGVPRESVRHVI